jgi:hypothetical protein
MSQDPIRRFMNLFDGYEKAHGQYRVTNKEQDGKLSGRAITNSEPASHDHYKEHLEGGPYILGIIMLKESNKCSFGCIDIDIRGIVKLEEPLEELEKKIRHTPLVLCRSKSGGAHLYLFIDPPLPASELVTKLNSFSAQLGYGGAEIFPKQVSRANDRDRGNWINLPYHGGDETDRYAIFEGEKLNLNQFLDLAKSKCITSSVLKEFEPELKDIFEDGPPCLQHLSTMGFPEGTRNVSLFNIGVYYRKKNPDDWQEDVMKHNYEHFDPPLSNSEASGVIKGVAKKEYVYTCKQAPICNYCERSKCLKRPYGVGGGFGGSSIEIDSITKYETENRSSVRWYIEIQGERIEVTTDQIIEQRKLQKLCVEKLNKCPSVMPQQLWEARINELLNAVEVINDPDDASPQGQFEKVLDAFLTGKVQARHRDEIMNAKPWHDKDVDKVFFRSEDLFIYLEARRFRFHSQHQIWSWLREAGGDRNQFRIKGKAVKVWSVPAPEFYEEEELQIPSVEEEF